MLGDNLVKVLFIEYCIITLVYAASSEWVKSLYWFGATILNAAILMGLK